MVNKFMILKTCPRTLEDYKDDISEEYEEGMKEFVSNITNSFFSGKS